MVKEKFEVECFHEEGMFPVDVYREDGCIHIEQLGVTMLIIEEDEWLSLCNNSLEMWGWEDEEEV